jgi:hypothetical protein
VQAKQPISAHRGALGNPPDRFEPVHPSSDRQKVESEWQLMVNLLLPFVRE